MARIVLNTALSTAALLTLSSGAEAQLLHRYSFDDVGPTVVDSVGGADGMIMGGATLTGSEVVLDGIDGHVVLPAGLASSSAARSFEFWFNWNGGNNWQRLMDFGDDDGAGQGITYLVVTPQGSNPASAGAIKTINPGFSQKVYSFSPTGTGVLTHVCVTFDSPNDAMSIYLDGVFQDTTTLPEHLSELNDINCFLGKSQWAQDPFYDGTITEFRIYDGVLTDTEVSQSFAAGPDGSDIGTPYCGPGTANSTGLPGVMEASGSTVAASNNLTLRAINLPASSFGFFLTSTAQGFVANPGGSSGNLCLSGAVGRYVGPGQIQNSGPAGVIELALDLTMTPTPSGLVSVSAGETWNFQAWHRDVVGGTVTSNFTDGLEVTFQ